MKALLTFLLVAAQVSGAALAQGKPWRTYSPPGTGFSVELPAPLRRVMSFEGEHGASLERDQEMKGVSCYASIETNPKDSRFGVVTLESKSLRKTLDAKSREDFFTRLAYTFVADDDETQFLKAPSVVRQNGLTGKEYLYVKESDQGSSLHTRGRIFDAGGKIYVLVFVGRDEKDLTSPEAERFLNSFRVRGRSKPAAARRGERPPKIEKPKEFSRAVSEFLNEGLSPGSARFVDA